VSTAAVELGVPVDPKAPSPTQEVDGTFATSADGFTVTTPTALVVAVTGVHPAVPDGTFVHATYGAMQALYGPPGAFVRLDNLDALGDVPNPTEAGTRAWYYAASGGGEPQLTSPFAAWTRGKFCASSGTAWESSFEAKTLALSGPGFSVTLQPGEAATFNAPSGEHAGTYVAKNVNIAWVGPGGGDAWMITNFTIARAP
jgi:hypothetical protein